MNAIAAPRPMGTLGQSLSGFILAVMVHAITWTLGALTLWFVSPLAGIVGGFAVAIGACAVAYDAVKLSAVRTGMRTYFWLITLVIAVAIAAAMLVL